MNKKEFVGLELCRFLCSSAVILVHYSDFTGHYDNAILSANISDLFNYTLSFFYRYGGFAVQVFWVISGFIFFWKYSEDIHKQLISSSKFLVLRLSRLYPLHFATLLIVALLQYIYTSTHGAPFIYGPNDVFNFLLQLFFASNWHTGNGTFNGPIWSVSAEIPAYICFYVIMRIVKPSENLCMVVVGVTFFFHQPVLTCINFFFAGGLVHQLLQRVNVQHHRFIFWSSIVVVVEISLATYAGLPLNNASVLLICTAIVTAFSLADVVITGFSQLARLGDMTYSSYLIHFPLQLVCVLVVDCLGIERTVFLSPFALLTFLIATFAFARVVYSVFEMRAQNAIRSLWLSPTVKP